MDHVRLKFLERIIEQCRFAIKAKDELDRSTLGLSEMVADRGISPSDRRARRHGLTLEVMYHQQSMLVALALVSRLLGLQTNRKHKEFRVGRRADLRVGDSCVLSDRSVRDAFEHIDERIDSVGTGGIVDGNISTGNRAGAYSPGIVPLSHIDVGTAEISSQDRQGGRVAVNYAAAVEEARRIAREAVRLQNEMFRADYPQLDTPVINFPELSEYGNPCHPTLICQ
jgi:hypothetical protein